MKTTFIFDTVLLTKDNEKFYARTLHYDLWKTRYLAYFDEINIVTRFKKLEDSDDISIGSYRLVNGNLVSVSPIGNYKVIPDVIKNYRKISEELRVEINNSDFVIIRVPSVLGNIAINICKKVNKPYLVEVVADGWDSYFYHTNHIGKIIAPFMHYQTKRNVAKSNNVLYVTEKYLQNRYPTKGKNNVGISDVIINFNKKSNFLIESLINRRLINIKNKEITFGIVGNYDLKTKGQHVAIKSLSVLNDCDFRLELIGAGNSSKLKKAAEKFGLKNVFFLGTKKAGQEMSNWYDRIDVLIVPSFQEGLPRVVVEAMSRGLLVIGSSAGGIPELISEEFIFDKGDNKKLSKIINDIFTQKLDVEKEMKLNYKRSLDFTEEKLTQKREVFYSNALKDMIENEN